MIFRFNLFELGLLLRKNIKVVLKYPSKIKISTLYWLVDNPIVTLLEIFKKFSRKSQI